MVIYEACSLSLDASNFFISAASDASASSLPAASSNVRFATGVLTGRERAVKVRDRLGGLPWRGGGKFASGVPTGTGRAVKVRERMGGLPWREGGIFVWSRATPGAGVSPCSRTGVPLEMVLLRGLAAARMAMAAMRKVEIFMLMCFGRSVEY